MRSTGKSRSATDLEARGSRNPNTATSACHRYRFRFQKQCHGIGRRSDRVTPCRYRNKLFVRRFLGEVRLVPWRALEAVEFFRVVASNVSDNARYRLSVHYKKSA